MEMSCSNCNQIISAHFCENCGQKKYKRIDKKYIWDEIQYTFLHTNKGFLYSVKKIILNPGKTAKKFIDGNRVNHYKPILLLFVLSGISAFITFKVMGFNEIAANAYADENLSKSFMSSYMSILSSYSAFFMLLTVPFYAFFTKIAFLKWGHNYYEHILINTYLMCFYTLANIIVIYPILYFFKNDGSFILKSSSVTLLFVPVILIWMCRNLYPEKSLKSILSRVALVILLLVISLVLLLIFAILIGFIYAMVANPESLKQMAQPKS